MQDILFLLDDLPEELVAEVLLEFGIDSGAVRQHLVLVPADDGVLQQECLSGVGKELLGIGKL